MFTLILKSTWKIRKHILFYYQHPALELKSQKLLYPYNKISNYY